MKVTSLSRVRLLATPWTAAYQAPPSMGFSRKEYWSGVSLPSLEITPLLLLLLSRFSRVHLCVTPQTAAHQAPLTLGFSRQEYWSGSHSGHLLDPGLNPGLPPCRQILYRLSHEGSPCILECVAISSSCFSLSKSSIYTAAAAKSLQSCLTLCDPTDVSLRGSPVPEILQARTLEWVAISFSNA